MNQDYTHITLVLDRSGSMSMVKTDAIGGYNEFVESQQKAPGKATYTLAQFGKATYTLAQFDDRYELLQDFVDISQARILNEDNYVPRGLTRLLDAIGKTMVTVGEKLGELPEEERPGKVVFAILTDGQENDSQEYAEAQIREMIKHQQDIYQWEVIFLSSDINCEKDALKYGIQASNTLSFDRSGVGTQSAFTAMAENLVSYRSGLVRTMAFSEKQKKKAKSKSE